MKQKPSVSFIICTYNRASYLDDTLRSLLEFNYPGLLYEFVIIDNNSTDRTPEVINRYREIASQKGVPFRSFKESSQGLSHARNRGIKEAEADSVVFFDDDIRATKSLIPAWCSYFERNTNALAAGGKIHVQFDAPRPDWMSYFLLPLLGHHDLGKSEKEYPPGKYPFGGNMGFKKSVFVKAGVFNTELGRKGKNLNAAEEKELFQRIRKLSASIHYLPDAFLYHRVDENRLTKEYIRKQALGIGKVMRIQMKNASLSVVIKSWGIEIGKFLASLLLAVAYFIILKPEKATFLIRFRRWIWKGYFESQYE